MSKKQNSGGSGGKQDQGSKKLQELDYYHYYLPREEVDSMLKYEGDFLLRESIMPDKRLAIVLSVKGTEREAKHFPVDFNLADKKFYFTENVGKPSLLELVNYHKEKNIPVGGCLLKKAIPRNHWEILDDRIKFEDKILGEGNFAVVTRGQFLVCAKWVDVACKKLKLDRNKSEYERCKAKLAILREFQFGRALFGHQKVLTIHGLYIGSEELAVVMEMCDGGSLDKYMEKNQSPIYEKLSYLFHASNGLGHMHKLNFIHRDVASRNFLVVKRDKDKLLPLIKIADFGLTRQGPVYKMSSEHEVPYLISALECLGDTPVWTYKSDSWSFGVLIWHIFEDCKTEPYHELLLANSQMLKEHLTKGVRLSGQSIMPPEIKAMMKECFESVPDKRPSIMEIQQRLEPELRKAWQQGQMTGTTRT